MTTKALKKQLMAAIAMVVVAAIALTSSTYAWFVNNNLVKAELSSVKAATGGTNLLIKTGYTANTTQSGGTTTATVNMDAAALIPASSNDTDDWYVVNGWGADADGASKASAYLKPSVTVNSNLGQYTDSLGTARNIFQAATYTIYTSSGAADVYLDPTAPVTITGGTTGMYNTLRVGIVVNDTLKLVYAPTTDTAAGNDLTTTTSMWRTVSGASAIKDATYTVIAGDSENIGTSVNKGTSNLTWTAVKSATDGLYSAPDNPGTLIENVGASGAKVEVYVWMEGTDEQCLIGTADGGTDTKTYSVTVNFAGVSRN